LDSGDGPDRVSVTVKTLNSFAGNGTEAGRFDSGSLAEILVKDTVRVRPGV